MQDFEKGSPSLLRKIGEFTRLVRAVWNMRGDGVIVVRRAHDSISLGIDINQLLPRLPKIVTEGTGGMIVHSAFVNGVASGTTIQSCYLDFAYGGPIIDVYCNVIGTTALNQAAPRLENLVHLPVYYDERAKVWRAFQLFEATEDC